MRQAVGTPTSGSWKIMIVLMIGVFLSPLNVSFTSVALPTMRTYFGVDIELATWVGTAYFIPSVAFMPLQAYVGQLWGIRRTYALGSVLLSLGALLAAVGNSFQWLLFSRILQGIGWSALYPLALVLIRRHYPSKRQGEMMGLWESAVGVATIVAPLAGGALVEFLGWQILYVIIGVVAAAGALLTPLAIPPEEAQPGTSRGRFDWPGALLMTLALTLFLVGVTRRSLLLLLPGLLIGLAWIAQARRQETPFVPPSLFRNDLFVIASAAAGLRMLVAMAALTALPLFFEDVQGIGPAAVGTLMVVYSLFLFFAAWPGGRWADRAGAHVPGMAGYLVMALGVVSLMAFGASLNVWLVFVALSLRGIGAGLTQAPYAKAAVESVSPEQSRAAAGMFGTLRYSGLALGSALVGILLQSRLAHYGASAGGAAAIPAYRELWLLLTGLALAGLALTWMLKWRQPVQPALVK